MDGSWNARYRADDHQDSEEESSLVPIPEEEPHAPPVDIDEREGAVVSDETIALPEHEEPHGDSDDTSFENQIDNLIPTPQEEPYHDDDAAELDPYDVSDQVDEMMPRPTGDARDEVDDFSTEEELDVETARLGTDRRDGDDRTSDASADGPEAEDDRQPLNNESHFYSFGHRSVEDEGFPNGDDPTPMPSEGQEASLLPDGTTQCPTCGRQTDALRFCSYCGERLTEDRRQITASSTVGRVQERVEMVLEPLAHWTRPGPVRLIMALGALLILLSLLANTGGLALIFGAAIVPLILLYWCTRLDVFEREPLIIIAAFALGGMVIGALLGWISSLFVANSWFDAGVLNYGAAGFGGRFAETAGTPPVIVWAVSGILVPAAALAAIIGIPIAMRQTLSLRNEIMDGLTITAAMGAGFSLGTAIVFASPMFTNGGPVSDASGWTLTVIGLTIIRPTIWTLSGAMVGAAAWTYLRSGRLGGALIPAVVGITAPLLFSLVSLQLQSSGLWPEILWGILVSIVVGLFYQRTLSAAITKDREVLGQDNSRIVCSNCHRVTPAGTCCSNCGADLSREATRSQTHEPVNRDRDEVIATPAGDDAIRSR